MNDDLRRLRRSLARVEPQQWQLALDEVLEDVASQDRDDVARAMLSQPTVACPPLTRHRRAALRHDWTSDELLHVETCPRCRRTGEIVASAVWHPDLGMLAARLSRRLSAQDEGTLKRHLLDDGCQSCRRLLDSPWLHELAASGRGRPRVSGSREPIPDRFAVGCAELPTAVGSFATGTRPPFHLRAVASRGDLIVTLRETDQGQLVVHVDAPRCGEEGQTVRVELLGDGDPLIADVELTRMEGEPGCSGRHAFGPFVELVPRLRPAVALLAVLADRSRA